MVVIGYTFSGSFLSLPDGLIKPRAFRDSSDNSPPSLNPPRTMSFKLNDTYLGNPMCIPGKAW
jgi:hypothetical protein